MKSYGLIEAGGTKFVLGVVEREGHRDAPGTIVARHRIATTVPGEVLPAAVAWFHDAGLAPAAIGIASFGPLDLDRASPNWGHVTRTTKPCWGGADLVRPFIDAFGCPVGLETDVNGAALAESRWGAGRGHDSLLYLTVGTGIGGGFVSASRLLAGLSHPEMGHIRVPRHPLDGGFGGVCRFHGDCLEGVASGPAIIARWGKSLSDLSGYGDRQEADMIAWYLGQAVASFQAILQPARIVLGGGVMTTPGLLDKVRRHAREAGGGYFSGDPDAVVVAPGLDTDSGLLGALAVALKVVVSA